MYGETQATVQKQTDVFIKGPDRLCQCTIFHIALLPVQYIIYCTGLPTAVKIEHSPFSYKHHYLYL